MTGYIYTLLDHLLFTPKMDFDIRFDITADITYKKIQLFKNLVLVQYSLFYSWKLEFPCLTVLKVALSKIKVKQYFDLVKHKNNGERDLAMCLFNTNFEGVLNKITAVRMSLDVSENDR